MGQFHNGAGNVTNNCDEVRPNNIANGGGHLTVRWDGGAGTPNWKDPKNWNTDITPKFDFCKGLALSLKEKAGIHPRRTTVYIGTPGKPPVYVDLNYGLWCLRFWDKLVIDSGGTNKKSPTAATMRLSVNLNTLHTLPSDSGAGLQVLLFWRIVNFTRVFQLGPT